jgi:hypothetical protein
MLLRDKRASAAHRGPLPIVSGLKNASSLRTSPKETPPRQRPRRGSRPLNRKIHEDLEAHKGLEKRTFSGTGRRSAGKTSTIGEDRRRFSIPAIRRAEGVVLCIPGRGLLMKPWRCRSLSCCAAKLFALEIKGVALICLCFLEHATPAQLHYATRRLRRKAPGVFILASVFDETRQTPDCNPLQLQDAEFLQGPLSAGVRRISELISLAERRIENDQRPALATVK